MSKYSFDNLVKEAFKHLPLGNRLTKLYDKNTVFKRFIKYGGWIALQFWLLRAPLVWLLVGFLPGKISLIIHTVPSYLVADFIVGLILAVAGFIVSEDWIWKNKG